MKAALWIAMFYLVGMVVIACNFIELRVTTSQIADNTGRDGGSDYRGGKVNEAKDTNKSGFELK